MRMPVYSSWRMVEVDGVLGLQGVGELLLFAGGQAEHADAAGHGGVGIVEDLDLGILRKRGGPAILEVTQAGGFAVEADVLVEGDGFANGVEIRGRVRADFLELADVILAAFAGGHQREGLLDLGAAHVEEASADGSEGPLMQADSVEVA